MTPGQPARYQSMLHPAVGEAAHTVIKRGNVLNRGGRNGSRVVGDGMLGSSIEISREISAACRPMMRELRSQSLHSSDDR